MIALALAVLVLTIIHAGSEYRGEALARWLGTEIGFRPGPIIAWLLYVAACANILIPLVLAVSLGSQFAWLVTAGALLGDAVCTHLLFAARRPPGLRTAPLQLVSAGLILWILSTPPATWPNATFNGWTFSDAWPLLPLGIGVGLFAPLRPALRVLKETQR